MTLCNIIIRVPKKESAFVYFQLEANENLCFYSTLPSPGSATHRDISISCTSGLREEVERLLSVLGDKCSMDILK